VVDGEQLSAAGEAIVGGVADETHSAVVAIGDDSGPWCSGTVISPRVVITAAHCVDYPVTRVFFGPNAWLPERVVAVSQVIAHPDYSHKNMANDLALLQLAGPAGVQAMPLLRATMDNTPAFLGADLTFVGYGVTDGVTQDGFGFRRTVDIELLRVGAYFTLEGLRSKQPS